MLWKEWIASEMEWEREIGREEARSEEGLILWIRVLREGFADLRLSLAAELRNSSAEDWREERRRFSMTVMRASVCF